LTTIHWLAQSFVFEPANILRFERYGGFYRPVIEVYFYTGLRLFGCDALPFHVLSIAIHVLCTLVLFLFAQSLTANRSFALLSAFLFSVQSGFVEAVSWVSAITELLSALWYLLALWMHLRFVQQGGIADYIGALASFGACLLTHESAATLLPMMIALEMAVSGQGSWRRSVTAVISHAARYLPFALF
jgi:protein O-mannosyl-transferase